MLVFVGFSTGILVGITGVGAGAMMTPLLLLVFGVAPVTAVGTDLLFAGLTNSHAGLFIPSAFDPVPFSSHGYRACSAIGLFAGSGHMLVGNLDFELLAWLLLGSVPGVWLSAKISVRMPQYYLRLGLAIVLATIGLKLTGLFYEY